MNHLCEPYNFVNHLTFTKLERFDNFFSNYGYIRWKLRGREGSITFFFGEGNVYNP